MVDAYKSPNKLASSAMVEGYFGELKASIINKKVGRMRVDKFLVTHLRSIRGSVKLVKHDVNMNYKKNEIKFENTPKSAINIKCYDDNSKRICIEMYEKYDSDEGVKFHESTDIENNYSNYEAYTKIINDEGLTAQYVSEVCELSQKENWKNKNKLNCRKRKSLYLLSQKLKPKVQQS